MSPLILLSLIALIGLIWGTQGVPWLFRFFLGGGGFFLIGYIYLFHGGNPDLKDYPSHFLKPETAARKKLKKSQDHLILYIQKHPEACEAWYLLSKSYSQLGHDAAGKHLHAYWQQLCSSSENKKESS